MTYIESEGVERPSGAPFLSADEFTDTEPEPRGNLPRSPWLRSPQIQLEDVDQTTDQMYMCTLTRSNYVTCIRLLVEMRRRRGGKSEVGVSAFVILEGFSATAYELEQSWESPSNEMIKLHNNGLTHEQPGSCMIFTQRPFVQFCEACTFLGKQVPVLYQL